MYRSKMNFGILIIYIIKQLEADVWWRTWIKATTIRIVGQGDDITAFEERWLSWYINMGRDFPPSPGSGLSVKAVELQ